MQEGVKVQVAARLDAGLRKRLRIYAAVSGTTMAEIMTAALDAHLPPLAEIAQSAAESTGNRVA